MSKKSELKIKIERINNKAEGIAQISSNLLNKSFLSIPYTLFQMNWCP